MVNMWVQVTAPLALAVPAARFLVATKFSLARSGGDWILSGGEDDPVTGTKMSALSELKEIKPNSSYLGVYLYPDGTVALDTAKGIPDDRFPEPKR